MSDTCIPRMDSHKDLGIILSENLSWGKHYKSITAHAYKVLGLIRHTFFQVIQLLQWLNCIYLWFNLNYFTVPKYGVHI